MSGIITDNLGRSSGLVKSASGGGGIISSNMATINGQHNTTSTSYISIDTGLDVTITPASTSSKFLLVATVTANGDMVFASLFRDSTNLATDDTAATSRIIHQGGTQWLTSTMSFLDAPNTDSSITYEVKFCTNGASGYIGDGNDMLNTLNVIEF